MSALDKLRRAPWLSGALLLVLAGGMVAPLALWLGARHWAVYLGLGAALLLLFGWMERIGKGLGAPRPPRARGKLRILPGGRGNGKDIDLAKDETTDGQRWLM
jgi:hypothetical protein